MFLKLNSIIINTNLIEVIYINENEIVIKTSSSDISVPIACKYFLLESLKKIWLREVSLQKNLKIELKEQFDKIVCEYRVACEKHPVFADKFTLFGLEYLKEKLEAVRVLNESEEQIAHTVLMEEIFEAEESYLQKDYRSCLQELAQCGAVIIRMMEFVEEERKIAAVDN